MKFIVQKQKMETLASGLEQAWKIQYCSLVFLGTFAQGEGCCFTKSAEIEQMLTSFSYIFESLEDSSTVQVSSRLIFLKTGLSHKMSSRDHSTELTRMILGWLIQKIQDQTCSDVSVQQVNHTKCVCPFLFHWKVQRN